MFQLDEKLEIGEEKVIQMNCLFQTFLFSLEVFWLLIYDWWLVKNGKKKLLRMEIKNLGIQPKCCRGFHATNGNRKRVKGRRVKTFCVAQLRGKSSYEG